MAADNTAMANMALVMMGQGTIASLTENTQTATNVNAVFTHARDIVLMELAPNFAIKRKRITAAGLLDCSAKTITFVVNSGADTVTDSGSGFVTGGFEDSDILSAEGSVNNNTSVNIASVAAGTLTLETYEDVTAETLTNDADLKLYALNPKGLYKYEKPSDCLSVRKVNEISVVDEPYNWVKEGKFITIGIIDDNDQILIEYVSQVTDTTLWTTQYEQCLALKLCSLLSVPIKEDWNIMNYWEKRYQDSLPRAMVKEVQEGNPDRTRKETEWEKSGH